MTLLLLMLFIAFALFVAGIVLLNHKTYNSEVTAPSDYGELSWAEAKPEPPKQKTYFDKELILKKLPGETVRFTRCGHSGPSNSKIFLDEILFFTLEIREEFLTEIGEEKVANTICPGCYLESLKKLSVRCCLCGMPILPGDQVALYDESSSGFDKSLATKVGNNYIGCMNSGCCPSVGFFAGLWTEKGFKSAFGGGKKVNDGHFGGNGKMKDAGSE